MFYPQCPKCEYEGSENYSLIDPAIIRCPQCDHIYSSIWCETCGIGGDFINNIFDRPTTWTCGDCGTTRQLPADIYAVIEGVEASQEDDAENNTSDDTDVYRLEYEAEKNNPYRRPVFVGLALLTIITLFAGFFATMLLATAGMFVYIIIMSYKMGAFPLKTGGFIIKKREPKTFYFVFTLVVLMTAFLVSLFLLMIFRNPI